MPPVNDNFASARVITANVSYTGETTVGATNEGSPSTTNDEAWQHDDVGVWYRLEWPTNGKWRIRVTNADFVYSGEFLYETGADPIPGIPNHDLAYAYFSLGSYASMADDIVQTTDYFGFANSVLYLRMGSNSSYPYYLQTGTFDISFEFITPPYNPGSPPSNGDMSTAQVLSIPNGAVSGTTHGAPGDVGSVWYRWEPASDVVIRVDIEGTEVGNDWKPYGDMYRLTGSNTSITSTSVTLMALPPKAPRVQT